MYAESDFIPLSALQHFVFCQRRCALVHLEQQWAENTLTVQGNILHERVHSDTRESRGDCYRVRGLQICSARLGIVGKTDMVEFLRVGDAGCALPGKNGNWLPTIIEYKRSRPKYLSPYEIQLCAQTICLEEMFGVYIAFGCLYFGAKRKRIEVKMTDELRNLTLQCCQDMHEMFDQKVTPEAMYSDKCDSCSLSSVCLPKATGSVLRYLKQVAEGET